MSSPGAGRTRAGFARSSPCSTWATGSDTGPAQLSGGQQQRVACARALITRPEAIFADEPTGNLDSRSGAEMLSLLRRSVRELGQTVIMVTHDPVAASYADRVVFLADGRVRGELLDPAAATSLTPSRSTGC